MEMYYSVADMMRNITLRGAWDALSSTRPGRYCVAHLVDGSVVRGRYQGGSAVLSDVALSTTKVAAVYPLPETEYVVIDTGDPLSGNGTLDRNGVRQRSWEAIPVDAILSFTLEGSP